jgi:hypothetical protein
MNPNSSLCAEQAVEVKDVARQARGSSLRERLYLLADAWRRLGSTYRLAEDVERKSAD